MVKLYQKNIIVAILLEVIVMEFENILTAISTVGFPIVMCIALMYMIYHLNEQHKDEMNKMVESLNNNTLAIQHLTDMMGERKE